MVLLADIHSLPLFVVAGLLLNITPGVDMALVLRSTAAQGLRAGAAASLGISAGCCVHIAAAALGMGALLTSSPTIFRLVQWAGAAYLVWLGVGMLRSRAATATGGAAGTTRPALRRVFVQGFLTNALNPKVVLFFLAFVPQFIRAEPVHPAAAFLLLGSVFVANGTLVSLAIAAVVAALRRRMSGSTHWQRLGPWLNRGVGALFVALGLRLALGAR